MKAAGADSVHFVNAAVLPGGAAKGRASGIPFGNALSAEYLHAMHAGLTPKTREVFNTGYKVDVPAVKTAGQLEAEGYWSTGKRKTGRCPIKPWPSGRGWRSSWTGPETWWGKKGAAMERDSAETLARARPRIQSLISKSEKARQKLGPETWQHKMMTDHLKALYMARTLMDSRDKETGSFSPEDRASALCAFAAMIARTQAVLPKFAPGTAQHTLLKNRLFALQLAENLICQAQGGEGNMWVCPICGRKFEQTEQHHFCGQPPKTIEEYIARQSEDIQPRLREVYAIMKAELPDATEKISWQMPTFWKGQNIIHFAAAKKHIGLYPGGRATTVFAGQLVGMKTSKGSIQMPNNQPLPVELIIEITRWCGRENVK